MFNKSQPSPAAAAVLRQAAGNGNPEPAAPAVGAAPPPSTGRIVKLSRPITTHAGIVSELSLRTPTFADYIAYGDIDAAVATQIGANGRPTALETRTDFDAVIKWATVLTGLDRIVLDQLAPGDVGELLKAVRLSVLPFTQGNSPAAPMS